MATHVSPGVYSKIIDLSEYLLSVPGTIGFLPIITEKGEDNVLVRVSGTEDYINKFGEPNLKTFGKYYGQGPYVALQHLSVSTDLYVIRALPDDAQYAHAVIAFGLENRSAPDVSSSVASAEEVDSESGASDITSGDTTRIPKLVSFSIEKATNTQKLDTLFTAGGSATVINKLSEFGYSPVDGTNAEKSVLMYIRGIGRGRYYNKISYMLRGDSNPANFGLYTFEVYEEQDGEPVLVESFSVSFDPESTDSEGETNFIEDVINKFSKYVRVSVNKDALPVIDNYVVEYYKNDPTINYDEHPEMLVTVRNQEEGFPTVVTVNDDVFSLIPKYYNTEDAEAAFGSESVAGIYVGNEVWSKESEYSEDIDMLNALTVDTLLAFIKDKYKYTYDGDEYGYEYDLGIKATQILSAYVNKAVTDAKYAAAMASYETAVDKQEDDPDRDAAIDAAIIAIAEAQTAKDFAQNQYDEAIALSLMDLSDSDSVALGSQTFPIANGSEGSMLVQKGTKWQVQPSVANQTLCLAYSGLLKKPVVVRKVDESNGTIKFKTQFCNDILDTDWVYFSIVYDAGYKPDVKQMAKELVETRMDCVLISDCGDNSDCEEVELYTGAVKGAADCRIWNSFYCARYEPYTRIYDKYNGCDVWLSPVYTMAKLVPESDALYGIWYAPAGYNRGVSSEIKELRWSANQGERDRLYLAQVNPIVHFPEGMTVWGQLTTQKKNSALSDLNCVRTVLYIKRAVEQFCKHYVFDHNDPQTHERIENGVIPMLSQVKAQRGLTDFNVEVGADEYEYKTKECHVNVTLAPTKVLERIQCRFYIK